MNQTTPASVITRPGYLSELQDSLSEFAARCRAMNWLGALFRVGVAQDIVADVAKQQEQIAADAYSAEQCVREALKMQEAAQSPDSLGGTAITPEEAAPITRLLNRAAEIAHEIAEAAR